MFAELSLDLHGERTWPPLGLSMNEALPAIPTAASPVLTLPENWWLNMIHNSMCCISGDFCLLNVVKRGKPRIKRNHIAAMYPVTRLQAWNNTPAEKNATMGPLHKDFHHQLIPWGKLRCRTLMFSLEKWSTWWVLHTWRFTAGYIYIYIYIYI